VDIVLHMVHTPEVVVLHWDDKKHDDGDDVVSASWDHSSRIHRSGSNSSH
jgi:hypothetical protein